MNKKKIFNDPLYGLIRFKHEVLYDIIDHPYFQRLRRISQQALSHYVYPGAQHTRFQHAIGALYLMTRALDTIISKDHYISDEEYEAACIAILLHDIGHGPFSHALENIIVDIHHEDISLLLLEKIGKDLGKDFSLSIQMFKNEYKRPFFNQLISSQLDVDRLDYLNRDSFYSGVAEGKIGYDRIITMMNVVNEDLVIEEKGVFSIEKFLMARRLMYWQVYLHKTVISAEVMLIAILERAKYLINQGIVIPASDELKYLLGTKFVKSNFRENKDFLINYTLLDDMDIMYLIKKSKSHSDTQLCFLCINLLERRLFKVSLHPIPPDDKLVLFNKIGASGHNMINKSEFDTFFLRKSETVLLYNSLINEIKILMKSGEVVLFSDYNVNYKNKEAETKVFHFYPRI